MLNCDLAGSVNSRLVTDVAIQSVQKCFLLALLIWL
jgi:hypothetical protein